MAGYLIDTFVADVQRTLNGYGLTQDRVTLADGGTNNGTQGVAAGVAIGATDTQIHVNDATGFEQGVAEIESETIWIQSVDRVNNILTLSPDGRGFMGSTATSHALNVRMLMAPTFPKMSVYNAINEAIDATYPTLYVINSTTFTWNPVVTTYQLPTNCIKVLRVTAQTIGPTLEWIRIPHWEFRAIGGAFQITGVNQPEIIIEQGAYPGRPIQVLYESQPVTPVPWGSNFETSGLQSTARKAVRYHAMSSLVASMDVARINVGSAQALAYDPNRNPVGVASKLSAQMYQRYQLELEQEQKRLKALSGHSTHFRIR